MPTPVKKSKLIAFALLLPLNVGLAQMQQMNGERAPQAAPTAPPTSSSPTEVDTSASSILDYGFNHKPAEGSAAKDASVIAGAIADKIKAIDALNTPGLDDPEVRARFETYLSLQEVPADRIKEYFDKMNQVSETLKNGDPFTAWKLLYALSEYKDLDAGISRELANRVETIWNSDRTRNNLEIANTQLRDNIETYNHNADLVADDLHQQALEEQAKNSGGKGGGGGSSQNNSATTNSPLMNPNADPTEAEASMMPTMSPNLERKMELTGEYLKLLEARAKIKLNEIKSNKMSDQDRLEFRDYIRTLYNTHRYFHVIIAADFYRSLFNQGDYPDDLSNQVVAGGAGNARTGMDAARQMASSMGVNQKGPLNAINAAGNLFGNHSGQTGSDQPVTVADEVTASLEINERVEQAVEVFRYRAGMGDVAAAADQLQEAFLGNEFHPALQGLPRDEKAKVGDFLDKLSVLKNQLEVRQFGQVEGQIAEIKKIATDFDATKPMALVDDIKLESQLRLGKARLLAESGHLDEAMLAFQTAAEEWPGNPALLTSSNGFFNTEDVQNQSTTEFDRLVKDQNYREIFDKQVAFAPAVKGDAAREQQLKDALLKVQAAEIASEKANMQVMNGDVSGAWETIEKASQDWPDDSKLNKLLASLSSRSADFVSALNKAKDAETKKEYGYSLTWYVTAQNDYPASEIANDGITRISKQLLTPTGDSPASSTN